jgi:hypothetical protein
MYRHRRPRVGKPLGKNIGPDLVFIVIAILNHWITIIVGSEYTHDIYFNMIKHR